MIHRKYEFHGAHGCAGAIFLSGLLWLFPVGALELNINELQPCPQSPNCVSSAASGAHFIRPFTYHGTVDDAQAKLRELVLRQPRTKIVQEGNGYLHATFTSRIFRFVDDVEFLFDAPRREIKIRSASRVGYSDLGVNRKRMEKLRRMFERADSQLKE